MKMARNPERDLRGHRCGSSYQIVSLLGVGSVAEVWLAQSTVLKRDAAVKVLERETLAKPERLARLGAEAHLACKLSSHAVNVWDTGDLEDGRLYQLMEFCSGGSLASLLAASGRLSVEQTFLAIAGPASALAAAHSAKLIHHDIKPDNILFMDAKAQMHAAKLGDFGIAKLKSSFLPHGAEHSSFHWMGTPGFMAPEQVDPARVTSLHGVDHRADIFSLGCVLYLCLTGRLPYPADSADEYIKAMKVNPRRIPTTRQLRPEIPLELDALVMGCIEPDRDRRTSAIEDVMQRFASAIPNGLSLLGFVAPRFVAR